jgi:hypothetical protein
MSGEHESIGTRLTKTGKIVDSYGKVRGALTSWAFGDVCVLWAAREGGV